MADDLERAFHEAGHVVAIFARCGSFASVDIAVAGSAGGHVHGLSVPPDQVVPCALAGMLAQVYRREGPDDLSPGRWQRLFGDLLVEHPGDARVVARQLIGRDFAIWPPQAAKLARDTFSDAQVMYADLGRWWPLVVEVAHALARRGTLTMADVVEMAASDSPCGADAAGPLGAHRST